MPRLVTKTLVTIDEVYSQDYNLMRQTVKKFLSVSEMAATVYEEDNCVAVVVA